MVSRPPGPKPHFLIGNFPLASREPLNVLTRWAAEFGDIFYYRAGWLHVYILNHPDLIETALVRNASNLMKDRVVRNSRWFFGDGLLTSEGEFWKRQRRLSQPAFHRDKVASCAGLITSYTAQMLATWKDGSVIDVHQEMMNLALRIVVRALFNVEAEETQKISDALNTMMHHSSGIRMLLPPFVRWLPVPAMSEVRNAVSDLRELVCHIIQVRHTKGEPEAGDLLSMLMQARDEDQTQMSDEQLRDEVLTFLLAGHETTALALSWTWYLLSQNAGARQKLHDELDSVLGGRLPTYADLHSLRYTDQVIKESMRIFPPAWSLAREVHTEFEVGGYQIPSGSNLVMSQWIMHRNSTFFPDPEKFDPDRWATAQCQKLPRFAYFPFGGGARQCIGAGFATMESVLVLATIASQFQLSVAEGHPVKPVPSFTLRPKHGIRVRLARRSRHLAAPIS